MKSSVEVREKDKDSIDFRLSMCYDGSDTSKKELFLNMEAIFQHEKLLNPKTFSRAEINHFDCKISERDFQYPIEIARAYLASKRRKEIPSIIRRQSKISHGNKAQFGNRLMKAMLASRADPLSPIISINSLTGCMPQKSQGKRTWHNLVRPSCLSEFLKTHSKTLKRDRDALKRDRDAGNFDDDARRICQKTCS